jgi:ribosomal protein S18 acetylase RimI-like enzyme
MNAAARERAIAFHHARHAVACDRFVPWQHGTAVFASAFPEYWELNSVRVEDRDPGLSAEDLRVAVDALQAGLDHRHVQVDDDAAGRRLRPGFDGFGWHTQRLVWLQLTGPAEITAAPAVELSEVPYPSTAGLRETWYTTSGWMRDRETAREAIDVQDRVGAKLGTRALAAWDAAGEPIGYVSFWARDGAAEVEQAFVLEAHRDRGIGGALVAGAVAAAGADRTYIVADDEEDAKRLYVRLGFRPVWLQHEFIRRPPGL